MLKNFFLSLSLVSVLVFGGIAVASDNVIAQTSVLAQGSGEADPSGGGGGGSGEADPRGGGSSNLNIGLENPIDIDSIEELILRIVEVVLFILYPVAILAIIYAGFMFITAQGNPEKINKAKMLFFWTIVGTGLLIGANVILELVKDTVENIGAF